MKCNRRKSKQHHERRTTRIRQEINGARNRSHSELFLQTDPGRDLPNIDKDSFLDKRR